MAQLLLNIMSSDEDFAVVAKKDTCLPEPDRTPWRPPLKGRNEHESKRRRVDGGS